MVLVIDGMILIVLIVTSIYDWNFYKRTNLRLEKIEKKHEEIEKIVKRNHIIMEEKEEKLWLGLNILDREFTKYRLRK